MKRRDGRGLGQDGGKTFLEYLYYSFGSVFTPQYLYLIQSVRNVSWPPKGRYNKEGHAKVAHFFLIYQ